MSRLKYIDPGRLNHRVTIMRYQESEDEVGNTVSTLVPLKTVWAEIRPQRGSEALEYYKINNQEIYKITIRFTDVTEKDVIVYKGRQFLINSKANPLEDGYYIELMCTESLDHKVGETDG